jgi:ADP-ribose pyrophosphatase
LPDYAVIVASTRDGRILFERQYKHGLGAVALFLPGGLIARGEKPLVAARRELFEETGYKASRWKSLGAFVCNSNYGCGRAHFFVATGARKVADPNSGDLEEMEILFLTRSRAAAALRNGKIRVVSAALGLSLALQCGTSAG